MPPMILLAIKPVVLLSFAAGLMLLSVASIMWRLLLATALELPAALPGRDEKRARRQARRR